MADTQILEQNVARSPATAGAVHPPTPDAAPAPSLDEALEFMRWRVCTKRDYADFCDKSAAHLAAYADEVTTHLYTRHQAQSSADGYRRNAAKNRREAQMMERVLQEFAP